MPDCETTDAISLLRLLKRKYLAKKICSLHFSVQKIVQTTYKCTAIELLCQPSFWKLYTVLYTTKIYFYSLSFTLALTSLSVEKNFCLSQSFNLNVQLMFNHSAVSTILIRFTLSTIFILSFQTTFAFLNMKMNTSANTADFIYRIYNDSKSHLEGAIWN